MGDKVVVGDVEIWGVIVGCGDGGRDWVGVIVLVRDGVSEQAIVGV